MSLNSKTNINISSSKWSRSYFEGLPLPLDLKVPGYVIFIFASIARFKPPTSCQHRYPGIQPERPHYWQYGLLSKPKKPPTKPIERNGSLHPIFSSKSSNSNRASKPEESATPTLALDNEAIENLLLISDVSEAVAEPSSSLVRLQPAIDEVVPEQSIAPTSDVDTQANNYLHL